MTMNTTSPLKIGILGAGSIASTMAHTLSRMEGAECVAIASRTPDKAREFAHAHGIARSYGSYESMMNDPDIELVYIATPHSQHAENAELCLSHGKHVLCEKAFTVNATEAERIIALARARGLLLAEAIWTRYMPSRRIIDEILAGGAIGTATSLSANLGYSLGHVGRLQDPALAGGALLDLGIYPLNFAAMVFGHDIRETISSAIMTDRGVDASNSITLCYEDGRMACLHSNMLAMTDRHGYIFGDKGYLSVTNINNCEGISVYNLKRELSAHYDVPPQISGYEYQVEACARAIRDGRTECPDMPHEETLRMMRLMDAIRASWGMRFPME